MELNKLTGDIKLSLLVCTGFSFFFAPLAGLNDAEKTWYNIRITNLYRLLD